MRCDLPRFPRDPDTLRELSEFYEKAGRPERPSYPPSDELQIEDREGPVGPVGRSPFQRPPLFGDAGPTFSLRHFASEIRERLTSQGGLFPAVGWAFAINRNGQSAVEESDAGGSARTANDGGVAMTLDKRLNIASVSKTITAVGVLRLLEANGLTIDDPVAPWLPASWTLGPQVDQLSFRHLLTHTSGIVSTNANFNQTLSYDALANVIFFGANPGASYAYLNANFALFRVIIPALWAGAGHPAANNDNAAASAFFYGMYFILEVFPLMSGAVGEEASTSPLDPDPTLYYTIAAGADGISYGDWSGIAGGGGWHMSARELAGFLAHITYNDAVLSPAARATMDSLALGWAPLSATQGQFGQYRGHGGSIRIGTTGRVRTAIMKFPIQVEAAVVANSNIPGYSSARTLLSDAYDAAWTS